MKINKKILIIAVSLGISSLISLGLSWGVVALFDISFLGSFLFFLALQFLIHFIINDWYESTNVIKEQKEIKEVLQEYNKKPFKQYLLELNCSHCSAKNEVVLDLDEETEFKCTNCGKDNVVYTNIMTASKTNPINTTSDLSMPPTV